MGIHIWYSPCVLEDASSYTGVGDMLQQGERTLSSTLGPGAGGCVLGTTLCAPVMGDEHLWRVPDCSGGNFSRVVVMEEILVMGIDCRPC